MSNVLWIDFDFDWNDQLARKYMKYQGQYYDVGTKVKIKGPMGVVGATFEGWKYRGEGCFTADSGSYFDLYNNYNFSAVNKFIEKIVEPVYPDLQPTETYTNGGFGMPSRNKPPSWEVEIGWIWYIAIMLVLIIFKDRWLGWTAATVIFFGWKNGFLNGGKK